MAVKKILKIWDDEKLLIDNIKFLKTPTKKVILPVSDTTKQIIQDLIDTYKEIPCAGIAANQIGYDKQIFIGIKNIDEKKDIQSIEKAESQISQKGRNSNPNNFEIYFNPQIDKIDNRSIKKDLEGCLSIPGIQAIRIRLNKIKIRYYNKEGRAIKKTLSGFLSRLFQHELDHLRGSLMINLDNRFKGVIANENSEENNQKFQLLLNNFYKL